MAFLHWNSTTEKYDRTNIGTEVPADAELAAGDIALYYDDSNGASALKIKAKSANGTVVTGTVALA